MARVLLAVACDEWHVGDDSGRASTLALVHSLLGWSLQHCCLGSTMAFLRIGNDTFDVLSRHWHNGPKPPLPTALCAVLLKECNCVCKGDVFWRVLNIDSP